MSHAVCDLGRRIVRRGRHARVRPVNEDGHDRNTQPAWAVYTSAGKAGNEKSVDTRANVAQVIRMAHLDESIQVMSRGRGEGDTAGSDGKRQQDNRLGGREKANRYIGDDRSGACVYKVFEA